MTGRRTVTVLFLILVSATPSIAQTVNARGATAKPVLTAWGDGAWSVATGDAYERLSAANRRIARAIHESQTVDAGPDRLTLDEIAAMKASREGGWVRVYEDLLARGLVTDRTLGQALSRYSHQQRTDAK